MSNADTASHPWFKWKANGPAPVENKEVDARPGTASTWSNDGQSPMQDLTERRRAQNRAAQRTYRTRILIIECFKDLIYLLITPFL